MIDRETWNFVMETMRNSWGAEPAGREQVLRQMVRDWTVDELTVTVRELVKTFTPSPYLGADGRWPYPSDFEERRGGKAKREDLVAAAWMRVKQAVTEGPGVRTVGRPGVHPTGTGLTPEEMRAIGGLTSLALLRQAMDKGDHIAIAQFRNEFTTNMKAVLAVGLDGCQNTYEESETEYPEWPTVQRQEDPIPKPEPVDPRRVRLTAWPTVNAMLQSQGWIGESTTRVTEVLRRTGLDEEQASGVIVWWNAMGVISIQNGRIVREIGVDDACLQEGESEISCATTDD